MFYTILEDMEKCTFLVSLFCFFCSHECNTFVQKGLQFLSLPKFALARGTSDSTGHKTFLCHIFRAVFKTLVSRTLISSWTGDWE